MSTLTITRSGNRSRCEDHPAHFRSAPFASDRSEGCRETPAGSDVPTEQGAKSLQKDGRPAGTVVRQEMQTKFGFEGGGSWGRRFRLFGVLAASALVLVACSSSPSSSSSSSRTTAPSATGSTSTTAAAPVAPTPTTPPTTAPESPATTTALCRVGHPARQGTGAPHRLQPDPVRPGVDRRCHGGRRPQRL